MKDEIVHRNVVILPDAPVTARAVAQSRKLFYKFTADFRLNTRDHLPHITLHQFAIPKRNLEKLEAVVREVAKATQPRSVLLNQWSLFGETGFFWNAELTGWLRDLHGSLLQVIDPLREGYIMKQHAPFLTGEKDISRAERASLGLWGNPLAEKSFRPHITLTNFQYRHEAVHAAAAPVEMAEFDVTSLHITKVGLFGTCPGSLLEIPLG